MRIGLYSIFDDRALTTSGKKMRFIKVYFLILGPTEDTLLPITQGSAEQYHYPSAIIGTAAYLTLYSLLLIPRKVSSFLLFMILNFQLFYLNQKHV